MPGGANANPTQPNGLQTAAQYAAANPSAPNLQAQNASAPAQGFANGTPLQPPGLQSPLAQQQYQQMQTDPRGAAAQQHYGEIAARLASLPPDTGPANPNMPSAILAQQNPDLYIAQYQQAQDQGGQYFNPIPFMQGASTGANALQAYNSSPFGQYNNLLPVNPNVGASWGRNNQGGGSFANALQQQFSSAPQGGSSVKGGYPGAMTSQGSGYGTPGVGKAP